LHVQNTVRTNVQSTPEPNAETYTSF